MISAAIWRAFVATLDAVVSAYRAERMPHGYRPVRRLAAAAPRRVEIEPMGQYERVLGAALWMCGRAPRADEAAARRALVLVRAAADARGLVLGEPEAMLWPRQLRTDLFVLMVDLEEHDEASRIAPPLGQVIAILGELSERPWVRRELLRPEP